MYQIANFDSVSPEVARSFASETVLFVEEKELYNFKIIKQNSFENFITWKYYFSDRFLTTCYHISWTTHRDSVKKWKSSYFNPLLGTTLWNRLNLRRKINFRKSFINYWVSIYFIWKNFPILQSLHSPLARFP